MTAPGSISESSGKITNVRVADACLKLQTMKQVDISSVWTVSGDLSVVWDGLSASVLRKQYGLLLFLQVRHQEPRVRGHSCSSHHRRAFQLQNPVQECLSLRTQDNIHWCIV